MLAGNANKRNPYHLDVLSPHYLAAGANQTPLIFTTQISFCVGIGLLYKKDGKVKTMAIYHSYSEHGGDASVEFIKKALVEHPEQVKILYHSNNLIRALSNFLADVDDVSNVTVIVHVNDRYNDCEVDSESPEKSENYQLVRYMTNQVCQVLGKEKITDFRYNKGGSFFCLMNDGTYYSHHSQMEHIARRVALFMHDQSSRKNDTWMDRYIVKAVKQAHAGTLTWMGACQLIYQELQIFQAANKPISFFGAKRTDSVPLTAYDNFSYILAFLPECLAQGRFIIKK